MRILNMETLQSIENKINKLIEQNQKDITQAEAELAKSFQAIEKANEEILAAQKEINSEKYTKAKTDLWTAERSKEFYEERLRMLTKEPLMEYAEFHEMVNNLERLADEEQRAYFEPLARQIEETLKIGDEAYQKAQKADTLMKKLDKDISKGVDRFRRSPDGGIYSHFMNGLSYQPRYAVYHEEDGLRELIKRYKKNADI